MRTESIVLSNMIHQGSVKQEDGFVSHMDTQDGNYRIEFKRTKVGFFNEGETNFKCQLIFRDKVSDSILFTVEGTEMDVLLLLDCMSYYESSLIDGRSSAWPTTPNGTFYFFQIECETLEKGIVEDGLVVNNNRIIFKVIEYNPLLQQAAQRLTLRLEKDEYIKLMDMMYFCFLIDTEFSEQAAGY